MSACKNSSFEYSTATLQMMSNKLADKTWKLVVQILTRHYLPNCQIKELTSHEFCTLFCFEIIHQIW